MQRALTSWIATGILLLSCGRAHAQATWRLVEEARFGSATDPRAELTKVLGVAVAPDGSVLVQEEATQGILRFAADGRFLSSSGGKGSGPGEFRSMMPWGRAPDGTLWINDPGNGRVTVMGADGSYLRTMPIMNTDRLHVPVQPDRVGHLLMQVIRNPQSANFDIAMQRRTKDGTVLDTLTVPSCSPPGPQPTRMIRVGNRPMFYPLLPPSLSEVTADGAVWCTDGAHYRVFKLRLGQGDTLRTISGRATPVRYPAAMRDSAIAEFRRAVVKAGGTEGDVEASAVPVNRPAILALSEDDQQRLWVMVPTTDAVGERYEVYSTTGALAARVALPVPLFLRFSPVIVGSHVYAVVRDQDDVPTVVRFRISTGK